MSLLLNMLSRLVITFLPRSKCLLISWLQSPSAVIFSQFSSIQLLSRVRLFVTRWTVAYQASPSMGFSKQEYWSGLPFPSPGDLPNPGIKPRSPTLQADTLPSEPPGKPFCHQGGVISISEIIDIFPSNLSSSLCFIQPGISHDVLCV